MFVYALVVCAHFGLSIRYVRSPIVVELDFGSGHLGSKFKTMKPRTCCCWTDTLVASILSFHGGEKITPLVEIVTAR
jgi:hypothetical protein